MSFLDYTGLQYFKGKLDTIYATISHNQASNTINAMTGYSIASSSSAITTSDTLNGAIGKLEYKIDSSSSSSVAITTAEIDTIVNGSSS